MHSHNAEKILVRLFSFFLVFEYVNRGKGSVAEGVYGLVDGVVLSCPLSLLARHLKDKFMVFFSSLVSVRMISLYSS